MDENKTIDPKLEEALKGVWDSLTDEQKEKAAECKTPEELTVLAAREGVELPDEVLDAVAGGYIHCHRWHNEWGWHSEWEIIDDKTGEVRGHDTYSIFAAGDARRMGLKDDSISDEQLERLRKTGKIGC